MFGIDIGLTIAVITAASAALGWYRSLTRSQYAREREYAHILKTLDQSKENINHLVDEIDDVGDRLSRVEILLIKKETI